MTKLLIFGDFKAADVTKIRFSSELHDLLKSSDLCICNFEVPIRGYGNAIKKSGPVHNQDENAPVFLKQNGFNLFLVANNHMMDFGKEGCEATLNALGKSNTVGAGYSEEAYAPQIRTINGKKIGFLSFVQYEFGVVESIFKDSYGVAWICDPSVEDIIKKAKQKVDYLVICPHAGVEGINAPLPEWRKMYKRFIDYGADVIIASHPHVPQGWETYREKPIFYSLGNFYFDKYDGKQYWNTSIGVEINISDTIEITPHIIAFNNGIIDFSLNDSVKKRLVLCNHLLENEKAYIKYIDDISEKIYRNNQYGLLRGLCGFSIRVKPKRFFRLLGAMLLNKDDEMYLLNAIRCESHRWIIQRALENRNKNKNK